MSDGGDTFILGRPPLRQWELTSNSTRYDQSVAAPSDEEMHVMWSMWSAIFFLYSTVVVTVFLGVIFSRRVRENSFNVYLVYLMLPDVIHALTCAIQCACLAYFGGYRSSAACRFQSIYLVFSASSNSWMNGVIAYEVHNLLKLSARRQRYFPPTHRRVSIQAAVVYTFCLFIAILGAVQIPWLPHQTQSLKGLVCVPVETDVASTIFFWVVFFPVAFGIPILYSLWATSDIIKNKLLPPTGKRRELAVYFFRIALVFVILWLPALLAMWILPNTHVWAVWAAGVYVHAQGTVSALVSLLKPDVYHAVKQFVTCRCNDDSDLTTEEGQAAAGDGRQGRLVRSKSSWYFSSQRRQCMNSSICSSGASFQKRDVLRVDVDASNTSSILPNGGVKLEVIEDCRHYDQTAVGDDDGDDDDDDPLEVDSILHEEDIKLDNNESSDDTSQANKDCQNDMNATNSAQQDSVDENV
jgi:hypothetical protein